MKKLLLAIVCCINFNAAFAVEYETIYSCGFEDGENMSVWDLANAAAYQAVNEGVNCQDIFYTGSAVAAAGSKSLYVSQDGGQTANFIPASSFYSIADFNLNLSAGNYTLSFDYKMPTRNQRLTLYVLTDRFDFDIPAIQSERVANANDWAKYTISFSLTQNADVWISFEYYCRYIADTEVEGLSIDNVILKKQQDFIIDENGVLIDYLGVGGHVVIPYGVKKITADAFLKGSGSITSYHIPASVEVIDEGALNWDIVENTMLDDANENYSIEDGVLYNKDKTTIICYPAKKAGDSFTIPETVKTIGAYTFYMCSNLASITIPAGVESINEGGVSNCENLTSITIPSTVTSIGDNAFYYNDNLINITVEWQDPTMVSYGNRILLALSKGKTGTLYVPAGTTEIYSTTVPWEYFATADNCRIVESTPTKTNDILFVSEPNIYVRNGNIIVENATETVSVFNISGRCVSTDKTTVAVPQAGVYLVKVGEMVKKVMVSY
jgi:hypothetical protein